MLSLYSNSELTSFFDELEQNFLLQVLKKHVLYKVVRSLTAATDNYTAH